VISVDNTNLFTASGQPALVTNGCTATLTFEGAPNATGATLVHVIATDDGGTNNCGNNTSTEYTFQIVLTPIPLPLPYAEYEATFPPANGGAYYDTSGPGQFDFGGGVLVRYFEIYGMTPNTALPASGSSNYAFTAYYGYQYSTNGGVDWYNHNGPGATGNFQATYVGSSGGTTNFTLELLSLTIPGTGSDNGFVLRESPTKVSPGRLSVTAPGSFTAFDFRSFLSINLELSTDGGSNFTPASAPVVLKLSGD